MKVLLIGGSGNISPAIARELLEMDMDVTVFNRGHHDVTGTKHITGDRTNLPDFIGKLRSETFDCVIDMICFRPDEAKALVDALAGRVRQLIFCSTVNAYAVPALVYPITEGAAIGADPAFTYAHEKILCENLLKDAADAGAFALTIVRPGSTVNDQSLPMAVLGDGWGVMHRMLHGKPILLAGEGNALWATAHRDDVGRAIAHAALNPIAYGQVYTIASETTVTWERYNEIVAEALGAAPPEFVRVPCDVLERLAPEACALAWLFRVNHVYSSAKARRDLGFEVTIPLEEMLHRMVRHHLAAGGLTADMEHPLYDPIIKAYREATEGMRL